MINDSSVQFFDLPINEELIAPYARAIHGALLLHPRVAWHRMGNMNKGFRYRGRVVETILAVPGGWFSNGVTLDGPLADTIQLLVHMLLGDQCTRFAISKLTMYALLITGCHRKYHGGDPLSFSL